MIRFDGDQTDAAVRVGLILIIRLQSSEEWFTQILGASDGSAQPVEPFRSGSAPTRSPPAPSSKPKAAVPAS